MNTLSKTGASGGGRGIWGDGVILPSNAPVCSWIWNGSEASGSSVNSDLEQGTGIVTTGYSKGFLAKNYVERQWVKKVEVTGEEISGVDFLACQAKQVQTYYVRRVVSPFEFYLEREVESKHDENYRHQNMQKFYEKEEKQPFEYVIKVSKMKCYAYYDRNSKAWWRVRVLDFESDAEGGLNRAYIYYCDTGKQESIFCEDLRNLPEQFRGVWGTVVLKCYLYDVLPISGDLHWSVRSMIFFNEWMENQRLGVVVMKWTAHPVVEHSPDFTFDCGVVLMEKLDDSEIPETINSRMVDLGYARSTGLMSCSGKFLEIPGFVPHFQGTVSKANKPRYQPKTSEPTFQEISFLELRRITSEKMADQRPVNTKYVNYCNEKAQPNKTSVQTKLPKEIKNRLAVVKMSFVEGPDKIFVHTVNKKLQLKSMEKEMREDLKELNTPPINSLHELKPGSVVICRMANLMKPKFRDYCRAFILEVNLTKDAAKVIFVDYGNILWVRSKLMYELLPKYHSIPSFVHRIHLRDIHPSYKNLEWDKPIRRYFFKYVVSYEKQLPSYLVHIANKEDAVKFVDLTQRLVFNQSESKWRAEIPPHSGDGDAFVTSMRSNPLLASHFYSHAVDILYEKRVPDSEIWEFKHLSHCLVERGYAKQVKPEVDKNKIHERISDGFGFL